MGEEAQQAGWAFETLAIHAGHNLAPVGGLCGLQRLCAQEPFRSTLFAGGYAAGYYGYKWAEVMDADAVAWFSEHGGGTRENGDWFRRTLLAPGGSVDAMDTYRAFRGRDPEIGPLMARLGLEL